MITESEAAREVAQLSNFGEQAVVRLFDAYRPKLARMVVLRLDARLVSKLDTEDILQEALLAATRRYRDYLAHPSVPFFVWLRQITGQILIDAHRRYLGAQMRDVRREVSCGLCGASSTSSAHLVVPLVDSMTSPSQRAVRNEMTQELLGALRNLEEVDREILVLRHLEELGNREVAQILNIDTCAASKRYVRALERLRCVMSSCIAAGR